MADGTSALFELELTIPNARLTKLGDRLVGFRPRYDRIKQGLRLLVDQEGLAQWAVKLYGDKNLGIIDALEDRYPLVVFHGDVGTGKTATAEAIANLLAVEMQKDAMLFKLSTRVRGSGNVGEMSTLINQAFDVVGKEAGKSRLAILIIDEADSLAANRTGVQSHHEDKVAVNTLIQKIDDVRRFAGRVLVILCTNHFAALDPAILRRAAFVEEFRRPDDNERREILSLDCKGLNLPAAVIDDLVRLTGETGPHKLRYTYSDIRTRVLPEALAMAFPTRQITRDDLLAAVSKVVPTRPIDLNGMH
ncbi:MAG TPA: ATP-binding protein [Fimbriimonadaceae bacterium]|jgi:SpoVK/Ycf46/Vps4 family AAA+-type ATPase